MKKSILNAVHNQEFIDRINRLSPESKALWGKMDAAQMLAHVQVPLRMAHGELKPKVNPLLRFLFGKMARKNLLSENGFKKNSPTMAEAKIVDKKVFEEEKKKLIEKLKSFPVRGEGAITREAHPFFGDLNVQEWDLLQSKHLDHHLSQFGV